MNESNLFFSRLLISKEEKLYFLENLSLLLDTGISPAEALCSIKESEKSSVIKFFLEKIIDDLESGVPLSHAIRETGIFPDYVTSLIKIGEKSGTLNETLNLLVEERTKSEDFQGKVQSAMLYPSIVIFTGFAVSIVISWFMLPKLAGIFKTMHLELPFLTKIILYVGTFLGDHGAIAVPMFLFFIFAIFYYLFVRESSKKYGQEFLFIIPGIGKLLTETEIARFGYLLGSLLNVGVPVDQAVSTLSEATPVYRYKMFYKFLHESIIDGNSFEESFKIYQKNTDLFSAPVQTLIISGEQSGKLGNVLVTLGDKFNKKTELSAKNLSVILEPIFLVIVWFVVVGIALAVILPIYSLIGGVSQ